MTQLNQKLQTWVNQGLISQDQSEKISDYEDNQPQRSIVLSGFLTLGIFVIGIGVISIMAANWDSISAATKLAVTFSLLISLAVGSFFAAKYRNQVLFEALNLAFLMHCLASIGLISQIYHTGGEIYQALLFWSLITLGLAWISERSFLPFVWTTGFLGGVLAALIQTAAFKTFFGSSALPLSVIVALLAAFLSVVCRLIKGPNPQSKALDVWTILAAFVALFYSELYYWGWMSNEYRWLIFLICYALASLTVAGIFFSPHWNKIQKKLQTVTIVLFLAPLQASWLGMSNLFTQAFLTIAFLTSLALLMASIQRRWVFQFLLAVIGIRFVILYFQALGGLALTGIGLISSGIVIIASVFLWSKYRKRLTKWAEEFSK